MSEFLIHVAEAFVILGIICMFAVAGATLLRNIFLYPRETLTITGALLFIYLMLWAYNQPEFFAWLRH